ncbi:MGT family glycosyltransferase [Streptomyces sp. CB02488]|uniref:macrolide family glycosyltransferase n=1 Tax=Streptomyces sp. CB02488 TaxID=1703920 RepID=UPI00093B81E3|nr:macrolide family glycosyltransferase [Streptomyces sp. CB02488]OKK13191.1 MGT family glycosyltransferase [Streptomyces sp. CB02488]
MSPADLSAPAAADTPAQPGKHVLWLGFPSYGHIKASLGVVEELLRRGHRVTYVIADRFAAAVGTTGARVVSYASTFPETITGNETATAMLLAFLEESFAPLEATLAAVAADPPQLVVHDVLASDTATAVSRLYRTPTVRVYAGFGTNEHVPQNGTEADPAHTPVDPDDPRLRDLAAALTARVEAAGVAALFADGRTGGDEPAVSLSFVVREFQTKGETFGDDYLFAGPCLRAVDFAGAWEPPPGDPPVLLVSLGTSANRHPGFFRRCAEAFTGTPWHIVMTLGRDADPAELGTLPPNVEVRSWLPHLTVLGHAAAFVCQGGTGSLMEAFHQGVPVVVVPQQQDQWATARQVVDLGLGRSISPGDLDAETLRTAVEAIADDAGMRHRVRELSRRVRTAPGATAAADRLEAVMADRAAALS